MRYVLHFNPEGTETLGLGTTITFQKLPKALKNGSTTKIRVGAGGSIAFTPRDETLNRFGCAVSEATAREVGLKGRQRYSLERSGSAGWFNLVPHSRIGTKSKRIDGPGVSVSIIEK